MRQFAFGAIVGGALVLASAGASAQIRTASAITAPAETAASDASSIKEYGFTLAPLAFVKFCMGHDRECEATLSANPDREFSLSELEAVNRRVNDAIAPRRKPTDPLSTSWSLEPSSGDCNDYAVTKRSRLIAAGWPSEKLRLAVVVTPAGQGHLVLVVRMPQGDMVLDNLSERVRPWQASGYDWVSMQSGENPRFWVAVGERGRLRQQRYQALAANLN